MSKQTIRYAVGQIAFLMKAPDGETLDIPAQYFGNPCVIVAPGRIRMLSDGSEWLQSSMKHRMLAFPRVGDEVMINGCVRTVGWVDHDDMDGDNAPRPIRLSGEGCQKWPIFEDVSLISVEHDPDIALLPADESQDEPEVKFAVGDHVRTEDGDGTVTLVDADDESLPYRGRLDWSRRNDRRHATEAHPSTPLKAPLSFKVGDKVRTPDGEVGEVRVVDEDDPNLPYAVRASDMMHRWYHGAALTPYEAPQKHMLTVEFASADDLAIAQGILGNLYVHDALDEADFPALTRVIERLSAVRCLTAQAALVAFLAVGRAPICVIANYHEKDGKLCVKA